MKKISLIILLFSLFLTWCLYNTTEKQNKNLNLQDSNWSIVDDKIQLSWDLIDVSKWEVDSTYLQNIFIPSTFSQQDLDDFQSRIVNYEDVQNLSEEEVIKLWTLYDNIWYTWKALIAYFDYIKNSDRQSYKFHLNLSRLLSTVCKIDIQINSSYCKKWIQSYYNIIEWFADTWTYKELVQLLIDMWEKSTAKKVYSLYIRKTWLEDESLSNQLK